MIRRLPEGLGWLSETRLAGRVYGAVASPQNAQLFSLGGSELFRGFDLAQRQGNAVWVGTAEWRVPLGRDLDWSCFDSAARLHRLYLATFYDVGCAYLNGHVVGTTAHACGTGLRMDVAWFSFMERTVFRFDVAKSVRTKAPTQFWLGFEHPF
jgi:hemolysin activation/secretion protein